MLIGTQRTRTVAGESDAAQEQGLGCSKQFMAALTEVAFKQLEATGRDLELFARSVRPVRCVPSVRPLCSLRLTTSLRTRPRRHAKRSIISTDDVKLCTRRNEALVRFTAAFACSPLVRCCTVR